jgi:hypothetical protein
VNGKALMSGLVLEEMEASHMLDVIHFLFEDDLSVSTAEQVESKSQTRGIIYDELYGTGYKYRLDSGRKSGGSRTYLADGSELPRDGFYGDLAPFDPEPGIGTSKPYVPPTDFDVDSPLPFGSVLDAPVG